MRTLFPWPFSVSFRRGARYLASLGIEAEEGLGAKLFSMTVDMGAVYLKENYPLSQSLSEIKKGINGAVENYYFTEADFKPRHNHRQDHKGKVRQQRAAAEG